MLNGQVDIGQKIDNPTASRTLLALMRIYWPAGCVCTLDIDRCHPHWWRFIRKKFFKYYTYDSRYGTEQDARRAVSFHLHENIRKTQSRERERVGKLIKEKGGTFLEHRPPYLSVPVWEAFCNYWDTPEFKKKSQIAKDNRKKQRSQHRSGATSFRRRVWKANCHKLNILSILELLKHHVTIPVTLAREIPGITPEHHCS
ncbi:hypothetical protein POM88_053363 [Heracleum sosnowskyi]|uniref:Uncharacterized protein n=1 Tax=Heracleum sosnowskyi TaxID=360622 RepID=A0AAD8GQL2_9APIA|nr:hypothetical protein POM88_053363 [Heracleum sosnowskyi]